MSLTINFNTTLMRGDTMTVNTKFPPRITPPVRHAAPEGGTQLFVQINASQYCMEPMPALNASGGVIPSTMICPTWAGGDGKTQIYEPWPQPWGYDKEWIMVNYTQGKGNQIVVDLSPLNGSAPTAVKFAWGIVSCDDLSDPNLYVDYGSVANCPIYSSSGFPANPFHAKITAAGKCECVPPQKCDA